MVYSAIFEVAKGPKILKVLKNAGGQLEESELIKKTGLKKEEITYISKSDVLSRFVQAKNEGDKTIYELTGDGKSYMIYRFMISKSTLKELL